MKAVEKKKKKEPKKANKKDPGRKVGPKGGNGEGDPPINQGGPG